jgi:hypothetical protein
MNPQEKHKGHPKQIITGHFGPHRAKMICVKCKAWVKWVKKS